MHVALVITLLPEGLGVQVIEGGNGLALEALRPKRVACPKFAMNTRMMVLPVVLVSLRRHLDDGAPVRLLGAPWPANLDGAVCWKTVDPERDGGAGIEERVRSEA